MKRNPGGKARGGRCPRNVDKAELAQGIKVELEHTDDRKVAREIACDHLTEDGRYYSKLATIHLDGGRRRSRTRTAASEWVVYQMPKSDALREDSKAIMSIGNGQVFVAFPKNFAVPASPDRVLVWRGVAPHGTDAVDRARRNQLGAPRVRRALGNPAASTFTVYERNEMTGHAKYVGTFASQADAQAYVDRQVTRSRKFATFEVWTGTPRAPRKPVPGTAARGLHGSQRHRTAEPTRHCGTVFIHSGSGGRVEATSLLSALRTASTALTSAARSVPADTSVHIQPGIVRTHPVYMPGGGAPGPFRIKTATGTLLAVCTLGAKTPHRRRADRARRTYANCSITDRGRTRLARERTATKSR